jgi:hypothetical protein
MACWYAFEELGRLHREQLLAEAAHQQLVVAPPTTRRRFTHSLAAFLASVRSVRAAIGQSRSRLPRRRRVQASSVHVS